MTTQQPQTDRPKVSEASISALIESLRLDPIRPSDKHMPSLAGDSEMHIALPIARILEQSGVPYARVSDTMKEVRYPQFSVTVNSEVRDVIGANSWAYGNEGALHRNYALAIGEDGHLALNLWRIPAKAKPLGDLGGDLMSRLLERACELVSERDRTYQLQSSARQARNIAQTHQSKRASAP